MEFWTIRSQVNLQNPFPLFILFLHFLPKQTKHCGFPTYFLSLVASEYCFYFPNQNLALILGTKFLILFLQVSKIVAVILVVGLLSVRGGESRKGRILVGDEYSFEYSAISCRGHSASLTDFGGVGDGVTSNTKAIQAAIDHLSQYASDGGAQLYVPAGKWLTGSFSLTSHFTLYLHKDAVLLASQVLFLFLFASYFVCFLKF